MADTLVLGYKNAIPKEDMQYWIATGVGHVWSISGFHMTLVSTWLFAFFYLIFRSIPKITRKIPARFPAIIFAWFGLLFYLLLSGIDVATVRAFMMTSLIFIAFIFGRNAFSLRNVCIAFMAIFLINPHYVMQPGFQLSFSAIFGLIWFFSENSYKKLSFDKKIFRVIKAATMTSIIATLFTAPFVAANFYSLPVYGLIGNLILLPVFSFAIMPLVMIGTIGALLGIMSPLIWSGEIYNWVLEIANKIAELPFAQIQTPSIPTIALFLIIIGFLCLIFINNYKKIRFNVILFLTFFISGLTIITFNPRPIFYATDDHELIAFVKNGELEFNKGRASNHYFAFDSWKQLNFEPIGTTNKKRRCVKGVCIYKTKNWTLAYAQKYVPLSENIVEFCRNPKIDFIVSYFDVKSEKCNHKILRGGFVIYKSGRIKYTQSNRWWHTRHLQNITPKLAQ
ncbi:MAG: ComEC/Rec2 family competence protein [Alphaproteobacteria bacterium]|nr:ComEC/Rec2 family competence protein [Alphaproteobacteria bacterium]MBN2675502.1 ComEC/Rec2 family competence protein [Alphaproteobacteria bacterium]